MDHNKENVKPLSLKETSISKISLDLEIRKTRSGKTGCKNTSDHKDNENT